MIKRWQFGLGNRVFLGVFARIPCAKNIWRWWIGFDRFGHGLYTGSLGMDGLG